MSAPIKDVILDDSGKKRLIQGVNTLCDTVASTIGAKGRTVLIETDGGLPYPTLDGYTVANSIFLQDPIESLGCEFVKEASRKTHKEAGDNTSLTCVLAQSLINNAQKAIDAGESVLDVKNKIEKSRDLVLAYLKETAIDVTDKIIYDVAKTSANGDDEIAKIVQEAFLKAGENGLVTHMRSETEETFLDFINGSLMEGGYSDELFINNHADRTIVYENPYIVFSDIEFQNVHQLLPFLEVAIAEKRGIVFVSEVKFDAKNTMVKNYLEGKVKIAFVNPPNFGGKRKDYLSDLALVCGTNLLSAISGANFIGRAEEFLGTCEKIIVNKTDTIIFPATNVDRTNVDSKISDLKEIVSKSSNSLEIKYMEDRIAKLSGTISIIKVGANIESELKEKIDRCDDAVRAVRCAKEEGVVAGGGSLLAVASSIKELDSITSESLLSPLTKILENAGIEPSLIYDKIVDSVGYDVKKDEMTNMFDAGIIDTAKAIRCAYTNAVSVATTVIHTSAIVTYKRGE